MLATPRGRFDLRALLAVAFVAILGSCGGGGGSGDGGGGGGGTTFSVTVDKSSLQWSLYQGAAPDPQIITGTTHGTYSGTVYVAAVVFNDGAVNAIDPNLIVNISGTQAQATILPVTGLAVGTYTGTIDFLACSDAACTQHIGGTPLHVAFTVTIKRAVTVSPATLELQSTSDSGVTSSMLTVVPGEGETDFTVSSPFGSVFQFINKTAGSFNVLASAVPSGDRTVFAIVTGNLGSQAVLQIHYLVTPPPGGEHSLLQQPQSLVFAGSEGAAAAPQTVLITQPTWMPGLQAPILAYTDSSSGWLSIMDTGGGNYAVTTNAAALTAGSYSGLFIFQEVALPYPFNDQLNPLGNVGVQVSFTVGPGFVRPADVSVTLGAESTNQDLTGTMAIDTQGQVALTWQAVSDAPWLAVTASGPGGSNLQYTIDKNWLGSTAVNFQSYTANVTISAAGTPLSPVSFAVTVHPQLPEVSGVGPDPVLSGQATRFAVVGRGFSSLADAQSRLSIPGTTISALTRDSDGKLLVDLQALPAGNYSAHVSNQLGITMRSASFTVVDAPAIPTAQRSVVTGYSMDSFVPDFRRSQFYIVSQGTGALWRIHVDGAGWHSDQVSINGVTDVGVLHGGSLVVTTTDGVLHVLDGDSYAEQFSLAVPHLTAPVPFGIGIAVTADGKAWLQLSNIPSNCPTQPASISFDPVSQTTGVLPTDANQCGSMLTYLPKYRVDRRGDSLDVEPSNLYSLDVGSGQLITIPNGNPNPGWVFATSVNEDGSRRLGDYARVSGSLGAPVGTITLPAWGQGVTDTTIPIGGTVSHDGTRVYILTVLSQELFQANPAHPQRVYVLDTSQPMPPVVGQSDFPVLGYFEISGSSAYSTSWAGSNFMAGMTTSLDDKTLYLAGGDNFIEIPLPGTLNVIALQSTAPLLKATHGRPATIWR